MSRKAERAFTLLEVMAAVAVLGMTYSLLIGWAGSGIHSEATSERRLATSLRADQEIARIESDLALGNPLPPNGLGRSIEEPFVIFTYVEPLSLPPEVFYDADPSARTAAPAEDPTPQRLRRVIVWVRWAGGAPEDSSERITYALAPVAEQPGEADAGAPRATR